MATQAGFIALFLPSLATGGAERVLLTLAAHWVAQGRRCDIVVASGGGAWEHRVPAGARLVVLDRRKPIAALRPLVSYLRRERPDVLLSSVFPANITALLAALCTRTPCVVREASRTEDDIRSDRLLTTFVNRVAMRMLYPRASAVIALTRGLARHVTELAGVREDRIAVVPNPAPGVSDQPRRGISPSLVLSCGRLVAQKDVAMLLDAFARVSRTRDVQLVILGNGPLQTELEARAVHLGIASRVRFEGYAADVGAWMRQASAFALPSQWEGFPNVLLEALAAGCPVVSTDCSDAVSEVLDGGRLGYIVPVGDTTAMADALGAVLDGRMCFEDAASHLARYDPSSIAARYLDILDRAAQGAH